MFPKSRDLSTRMGSLAGGLRSVEVASRSEWPGFSLLKDPLCQHVFGAKEVYNTSRSHLCTKNLVFWTMHDLGRSAVPVASVTSLHHGSYTSTLALLRRFPISCLLVRKMKICAIYRPSSITDVFARNGFTRRIRSPAASTMARHSVWDQREQTSSINPQRQNSPNSAPSH